MPWEDNYSDRLSQEFSSLQQTIDQAFVEWFDDEYGYEEYSLHITLVSVRYVNLKKIFGKLFLINSLTKKFLDVLMTTLKFTVLFKWICLKNSIIWVKRCNNNWKTGIIWAVSVLKLMTNSISDVYEVSYTKLFHFLKIRVESEFEF